MTDSHMPPPIKPQLAGLTRRRSILLTAPLLFSLLLTLFVYHLNREVKLDVGDIGDGVFVSNFYGDELDVGYRYRWTKAESQVTVSGLGSAEVQEISVRSQAVFAPDPLSDPDFALRIVGAEYAARNGLTAEGNLALYRLPLSGTQPTASGPGGELDITFLSKTTRPPGDARDLGVKVDRITLLQSNNGLNLPPLSLLFWVLIFVAGTFGLFSRMGNYTAPIAASVAALMLAGLIAANPLYVSAYLPFAALVIGAIGLTVGARSWLSRWPFALDRPRTNERFAHLVMLSALMFYGLVSLWVIVQGDWIGHADYAENAVVARNFVQGRGLTVDYVAQFYKDYPGITHPAETWPLLQPVMIAPFFALFGPETWAAKLPNVFVMLGLGWMVYLFASRLWDRRVGLLAGLLTLAHPYFFNSAVYPINDLPFTAIFFGLAWLVWQRVAPNEPMDAAHGSTQTRQTIPPRTIWTDVLIGSLAGLLVWCKPSGAVLLVGLGLWAVAVWVRHRGQPGMGVPWRGLALAGGVALLVLSPLLVRNFLAFGQPYFTTESYDASILRYWNGDPARWEPIYSVYVGGELPHPRWVIGGKFGYDALFDAFGRNLRWVWERGVLGGPAEGDYVLGLLPLSLALLGLALLTRKAASLFVVVGISFALYAAFVLIYWHYEGRYFQVVVPWLYMLGAYGTFRLWDLLREKKGISSSGLLLFPIALLFLFIPHLTVLTEQVERDTRPTGFAATMRWLRANSTADDVVMTRDPWELNWYTERKAVMIPYNDLETVKRIASQYGVTMLQLGGPVDRVDISECPAADAPQADYPTGSRPALGSLYCGREIPGFTLVYKEGGGTIYRLDK